MSIKVWWYDSIEFYFKCSEKTDQQLTELLIYI